MSNLNFQCHNLWPLLLAIVFGNTEKTMFVATLQLVTSQIALHQIELILN